MEFFHIFAEKKIDMPTLQIKSKNYELSHVLSGLSNLDKSDFEGFVHEVNKLLAIKKVKEKDRIQAELLQKIYEPFDTQKQERYDELMAKMELAKSGNEAFTEEEYEELLALNEDSEKHNVESLKALNELSQLNATSLESLLTQLHISTPLPK